MSKRDKLIIVVAESNSLKGQIVLEYFLNNTRYNNNMINAAYYGEESGFFVDLIKQLKISSFSIPKNLDPADFTKYTDSFNDVCIVLLGWPYIVEPKFLSEFPNRVINCHGSYLPDYKGSRAYMHYWANIESHYGASIHYVSEKIDEGKIIKKVKVKQFIEESPVIIHRRIAELTGLLLDSAIELVFSNYSGISQESGGRYFKKIPQEEFIAIRKYNEATALNKRITTPFKFS